MWRWWILAGVVVMALGVVAMVAATRTGGPSRCIESSKYEDGRPRFDANQVDESFHKLLSSRLDVTIGDTAWLTMAIRNTQDHEQMLAVGLVPPIRFIITTPDCRVVWSSPRYFLLTGVDLYFKSHEEKRLGGEWSLTDNLGELVSPGYYYVYGIMDVDGDPTDGDEKSVEAQLVASKTVEVSRAQLRTARIGHPPTPAHPCMSGSGLVYETHVRQVMERRSDVLKEWRRWSEEVLAADILDEDRMPTGRRGIRVVKYAPAEKPEPLSEDPALRNLPDCLDGVPVQLVVKLDP